MRFEIGEAADRVVQRPVRIEINGVDCEIAPRRVFRPIGIEGDARTPPIGLDIAA
jgi:hypothetical protein